MSKILVHFLGVALVLAGCMTPSANDDNLSSDSESPETEGPQTNEPIDKLSPDDLDEVANGGYRPRVIIGIPDTGLNPYHEIFYRPELTDPPCTYLKSFPCGLEKLPLSVGGDDWEAAMKKDEDLLKSMEEGTMYWIPQTVFVAVICQEPQAGHEPDDKCLTDFERNHGTGVAGRFWWKIRTRWSPMQQVIPGFIHWKKPGSQLTFTVFHGAMGSRLLFRT